MLEPFRPTQDTDEETLRKVYFLWGQANDHDPLKNRETPLDRIVHELFALAEKGQFFTAPYSDEEVAVMAMYSRYKYVAHIEGLAVDKSCRGQGLGSRALREVIELAENDGVHILKVLALAQPSNKSDPSAIKFYEKAGFHLDPKDDHPKYPLMIKRLK